MRPRTVDAHETIPYIALGERSSKTRTYKILRLSIVKPSRTDIKEFVDEVLADERSIGVIECVEKGGMVHKPIEPFDIIAISKP